MTYASLHFHPDILAPTSKYSSHSELEVQIRQGKQCKELVRCTNESTGILGDLEDCSINTECCDKEIYSIIS